MHGNRQDAGSGTGQVVECLDVDVAVQNVVGQLEARAEAKRARCTSCRALVAESSLDSAGRCDCCVVQRGLFAVKPWRSRKNVPAGGGRRGRR